jgi:hypothetical protein
MEECFLLRKRKLGPFSSVVSFVTSRTGPTPHFNYSTTSFTYISTRAKLNAFPPMMLILSILPSSLNGLTDGIWIEMDQSWDPKIPGRSLLGPKATRMPRLLGFKLSWDPNVPGRSLLGAPGSWEAGWVVERFVPRRSVIPGDYFHRFC